MEYTLIKKKWTQFSDWILSIDKKAFKRIFWILFVADAILWGLGPVLQKIHVGDVKEIYETYLEFRQYIPATMVQFLKGLRIPLFVLLVIDVLFLFWRRRYILVSLCSFSPDLEKANVGRKNRRISRKQLNLCDEMRYMKIPEAVAKADEFVERIQKDRNNAELGIYGIMHTPLLFRIGYDFGDQSNADFYHKARTNNSCFEEWKKDSERYHIAFSEKNKNVKSDEMLVSIATSLEIKDSDIACLNPKSKHILKFEGDRFDFDALKNYADATEIRDLIMKKIREKSKEYEIKKVHMVIASSVAFTIFLGMAYSKQHDPECIVYHYEKGRYHWGISICSDADKCFVGVSQF